MASATESDNEETSSQRRFNIEVKPSGLLFVGFPQYFYPVSLFILLLETAVQLSKKKNLTSFSQLSSLRLDCYDHSDPYYPKIQLTNEPK